MTLLLMLLLKSFLVFALSGAALLCLRRASASARHLVCLLTLSALLALPLFSLTLPGWHVAALSTTDRLPPPTLSVATEKDPPAPNNGGAGTVHAEPPPVLAKTPAASSAPPLLGAGGNTSLWPLACLSIYGIGVVLAGLRPLLGLWGLAHLRRGCVSATDTPTLSVSADCAAALRLTRSPLLCRADVPVPMTWGGRRPVVLLPSGSEAWPEDRLRSVLLHEMAHVKRRDWTCHRLADVACALYWFHPLVWLLARRLRSESEVACDDLVLSSGIAAPEYARHLLEIAGALSRPLPTQSAIAMAQTPHIKRRILMILDKTLTRRTVTRRVLLVALVPTAAALLVLATLRPSVKAQVAPSQTKMLQAASFLTSGIIHATFSTMQTTLDAEGKTIYAFSPDLKIEGTTLFAGGTNPGKYGSQWWSASGAILPESVYNRMPFHAANLGSADANDVSFALRLPPAAQGVTIRYKLPQSTESSSDGAWPTKTQDSAGRTESQIFSGSNGTRIVTVGYPPTLKTATIQVGIAAGTWTTAVDRVLDSAGIAGATRTTSIGSQTFLVSDAAQTTKGTALTISTAAQDDIRIVALGNHGDAMLPADIGDESTDDLKQITAHFSQPLSQIKEFRVETRPFQWIEFKDVALQPVK